MKFSEVVRVVGAEPVFDSGLLLAGDRDPADVRRQLARWCRDGRVVQLRRGLYALAPPYRQVEPHPFVVANRLVLGSYVSCQSALAHFGLIPEQVPAVTSVAAARPRSWETPLGRYAFRHLRVGLLWGFEEAALAGGQAALLAAPEKALLDLVYLEPAADSPDYLAELRLQNLDRLDRGRLALWAARTGKPKLRRAAARIAELAQAEDAGYEAL
jgi:hypothetical protein